MAFLGDSHAIFVVADEASRPSSDTNACALSAADYSQIFVNAVHGILPGANQ